MSTGKSAPGHPRSLEVKQWRASRDECQKENQEGNQESMYFWNAVAWPLSVQFETAPCCHLDLKAMSLTWGGGEAPLRTKFPTAPGSVVRFPSIAAAGLQHPRSAPMKPLQLLWQQSCC